MCLIWQQVSFSAEMAQDLPMVAQVLHRRAQAKVC